MKPRTCRAEGCKRAAHGAHGFIFAYCLEHTLEVLSAAYRKEPTDDPRP